MPPPDPGGCVHRAARALLEDLVGDVTHHDRRQDGEQPLDHRAAQPAGLVRIGELARHDVGVVAEHVPDDLLAVGPVDLGQVHTALGEVVLVLLQCTGEGRCSIRVSGLVGEPAEQGGKRLLDGRLRRGLIDP
jgi:hypothetical protein